MILTDKNIGRHHLCNTIFQVNTLQDIVGHQEDLPDMGRADKKLAQDYVNLQQESERMTEHMKLLQVPVVIMFFDHAESLLQLYLYSLSAISATCRIDLSCRSGVHLVELCKNEHSTVRRCHVWCWFFW